MTSVEKRRSGRRSGGHRKHSDGGYSDTSSGGSFPDETDREVSNLTDRAFRSLCIGDEAVYNDSDLCSSSPCIQRDRQMAFSQSGQDGDREGREGAELKRAGHESFSLRMQQYGQDWTHGGMYGAEIQRDPQWEVYGERTQGRVSATFQHSFVETSQQEESLGEEQLSFLSNGATESSSQQRRSRSRVSSLIRAFNSEGQRDEPGMDGKPREWNDETSWDKSALMSIQRELSEFSTSYQQNYNNSGHFPSAGSFSSRDTNFYSSEVAQMNSASSFMRSSHSKHSMSTQVNCNSNFFIHSEFSPFKVWRDHNRFPFQQGGVSGFMHCSEFPKWYETPMYRELSLEAQPQGPYRFEERGIRYPSNNLAPVVPPTFPRSTSTSSMQQKASAVEKRCESELTGHYPHRKRTQSLGTNRLPSQRPSTASPTSEMSRRVRDTISSVKALQQKIKMMTEQNITTGMTANQQGVLCSNDNFIPFSNDAKTVAPNVVSSNTSTTPFNISQQLTPLVHAHHEAETSEVWQDAVSPQPVEHPPVRAESRGATPDARMSSYKSRATSLLFNLKDNRKRVKSTYSPAKFKGLETLEKNKQTSIQEPRDTVIDIPDFPDPDIQFLQAEESSRTNAASHQYGNQYHSPGLSLTTGQYSQYTSSDYQTAQMQSEMVHHPGFTGFIHENYAGNQPANGQNLRADLLSFNPYNQAMIDNVETLGGDVYRLKPSYTATETPRLNADNNKPREYLISKANAEQHFNETVEREFTKADRYQQLKNNKHDYSNVSSQDGWRQTNSQDIENLSLKAVSPWKQEINALMEKDQHAQAYQRAATIKELNSPRDKYRENPQSINKELEKIELRDSFGAGLVNPNISNQLPQNAPISNDTIENPAYYGQQQPGAFVDKHVLQKYYGHNTENEMKDNYLTQNYNRYTDQEYRNQHTLYSNIDKSMQETGQRKQYTPIPKGYEMQSLQPIEAKPLHYMQKNPLSNPDNVSAPAMANQVKEKQFAEVKAEQAMAEHIKVQHAQAELAKAQHWAQVEQPRAASAGLILAGQTGSEKVRAEQAKEELTKPERANQAKAKHNKEEKRKEEWTKQSREKPAEQTREERTKAEQTRVQKVTEEPRHISEEVGAEHLRAEQGEQVKAKQAEAERLKEERIKTELAKAEQARLEQARSEQAKTDLARRERVKAEQIEEERVRAEQIEREQMEAEQIRIEKVKAEQADAERRRAEQAKLEQIQEQQAKAEQEKTKLVEVGKVEAHYVQVEDVKQEKAEKDSIQAGRVNAEQHTTQIAKEREAEQAKLEQTKVELAKAELTKKEHMQDRSAKPAAVTQPVKREPDKIEQVKIELAKAKAELAKIKEKMRGEQKEKVRNTVLTKEDGIKTDVPLKLNIHKNEEYKDQNQATQMLQHREESYSDQANRGLDEYRRLREKYGFNDTTSLNRNKASAAENVSSNDAIETPALALDKVETKNNEKSKDKSSPTSRVATANTESKEEVGSFKPTESTESQYVYSESSKEFKLSGGNYLPIDADKRVNSDTVTDKVKDGSNEKLEKRPALKYTDISQQRDSDLARPLPLERIPKSTESNVGPGKDQHITLPRVLSLKERAQTKQEILTSKIKAHAEKEISAIKEKGFAVRDGFISKNAIKQFTGIQSINIRQRPPSQEVSIKHESTMSSNITPKHPMEPSGIQMEPVKSVSPPSSATIPVKSAATTIQVVDHSQKQVPKEPMKSNDNLPKQPREAKQMGSYTMSKDEGLVENQKKENQSQIKSIIKSKEQAPENKQGKQEANQEEKSGKPKEGLKDNPAVSTDHLNKEETDPSLQATALAQAESSKPMTTEKAKSKHKAVLEDSAALSPSLVFGQNKTPVADDSLQITGIMVTVRERKPSIDNGERNNTTLEQMNVKDKECRNSAIDKCPPSSGLEVSKGNTSSKEVSVVKPKDGVVQNTQPTVKEDQSKVVINNHPENVQENSTLETIQNNVSENATVKRTNLQQEGSSINERPQRVTQLQDPVAEKGVPSTVTVLAKNKVLAETQPLLYKQDAIASERKDYTNERPKETSAKSTRKDEVKTTEENSPQKMQTAHTNENFMAKVANTAISYSNGSNRADAETLINHDIQPSVKEDMTTGINPSKSRNIDDKSAPLVEEKKCDSTPPKPFNKTSPSNHLTENQNTHVSPKDQYKEAHIGENNQVDDGVHIGSIAIRVVPAVTDKDNLQMVGKHHVTTVPSDVVAVNEQQQVASSSLNEKVNTLNNEDRTNKDLTPASSEKQMKDSLEDELRVQCVLSSVSDSRKNNNQQNSMNATSENTQAENGKPEKVNKSVKSVDESKIRPMVEDYFQVQGVEETDDDERSHTNVGDTSDAVSKRRELPGLLPNKAAISNESCNEGKNEVFVLDQSKRKTVESSPVRVQDENMKRKNRETEDNQASKQSDGPAERQSNKNEKTEAGQAIPIRKHHTENQSSLSARDRQSSRNSHPTKENTGKEKPEVKPKPKERVSTIPEISALADYARLKVIVSEDEANPIQEFPPNKKEGFFPLIQTRHSRRPVFTADPQDLSVKEKKLPTKKEISSKVNKEPKPLVFPITERKHQRTGMFKLGDKERQEKMLLDARANDTVDTGAKHTKHPKERNKSPTTHLKNQGSEKQVSGTDTQRVHQVEQSIQQPNNPPSQATTSSSTVNRPRSKSVSRHLKQLDNSNPHENALAKNAEERTEKMRQERLATQHEETKTQQQSSAKPASRIEEDKRAEDMRVKHMIEETRASLAEEERRAAQREDERRAREREAIAIKIKERREKQREAERRAEEERTAKKEEEMREKQREERRMKELEEKRRIKIEQKCRAKLREEEVRIKENGEKRRVKQREEERAAQEEQQRRAAQVEHQRRAAQDEEHRRAAQEEQQRRAAQEEHQRRAAQEEQQRRAAQEEQQRKAAQEEQQRKAVLIEEQRRAKQIEEKIFTDMEEKKKRKQREEEKAAQISEEERIKQIQEQKEDERRAIEKEKTIIKQREEKQAKEERTSLLEKGQAAQKEETRVAPEQMLAQREDEIRTKEEEKLITDHREKERDAQMEEQKRATQRMDALQYYAITSTESDRIPRERQLCSPLPSQQRHNPAGLGSTEDSGSHTRPHRPHAPASPAPSLPRSNTSSPALGGKPTMFRVKDNTIRGSSFTKSVKPRFHKNFGEDFRVGSPMERWSERGEEEQEVMRRSAGTPVYPDAGLNRLSKESSTFRPAYSSQDHSALLPQHRPYSRRSVVLDEDDSRSIVSNMSEDVESFATSATDLADIRGLYDDERPESACSFSSDVSRSLGKPPTVPPKSEKALRRAQRLTTRRIKKELSKVAPDRPARVEKSPQDVSSIPSSSIEVRSFSRQSVASPHFSSPVSLAHAPTLGSSLPSAHTEQHSSHSSFYASPHATGPISLPVASPHATAPVSLPVASPNAAAPASHTAAPTTVAHVPSSPTLHHATHPAPVTQYHVESSYPHSYPLTQRKVLQDLGSGQYFVVDVPVQVKTKTFFDPETGKYVQLNVRESGQSTSGPQIQQTYPQPQLQPQVQVKLQQQPQASPAGKPFVLYQGNHGYPQNYQPPAINHMSSAPSTLHQDHQPDRESHGYGYPAPEVGQISEGHRYSPEKTPYMDTVNDKDKTYNPVYNTHGTYGSECDTNSQLAGSSVCENDNSAPSQCQPLNIITMGELEDFMEVSDW
ncbi:uncharacterized protein LOC119495125 isoform X2 [Sebastes umbrosus]|uniref:uncharacterized protein LOC119495125 isoform X2 n=1 Tax=Sebastes umbrosus TaxID=72105 RepID=UPI00189F7C93|nr:uncharacterized protein LOC119495125 isoform X2 [Sebastes umbrosus]